MMCEATGRKFFCFFLISWNKQLSVLAGLFLQAISQTAIATKSAIINMLEQLPVGGLKAVAVK